MLCTRVQSIITPTFVVPPDIRTLIKNKKINKFVKGCCPQCQAEFMIDDPWLTSKEAAPIVGFEPDTLVKFRHLDKYDIPFVRIGRAIRYSLSDLLQFKMKKREEMKAQLMP